RGGPAGRCWPGSSSAGCWRRGSSAPSTAPGCSRTSRSAPPRRATRSRSVVSAELAAASASRAEARDPRAAASDGPDPALPAAAELVVEARDLEVVLPGGDGVGPWTGGIAAGEQVLLLGPSGCGKSTLLRTLAGAIPSHQRGRITGTLRVGGSDPVADGVLASAQLIGQLGQDPADGVCLPQVADD